MQRWGPESESKHLSLGRETAIPPVGAAGDHLHSGSKGQQDFSVLAPFMCEQSSDVFNIGGGIINFRDGPLNGNDSAFPWEGKQVAPGADDGLPNRRQRPARPFFLGTCRVVAILGRVQPWS